MSEPHEAAITTFLRVRPCKRSSGYFQHGAETDGVPAVDVEVPTDEAPCWKSVSLPELGFVPYYYLMI